MTKLLYCLGPVRIVSCKTANAWWSNQQGRRDEKRPFEQLAEGNAELKGLYNTKMQRGAELSSATTTNSQSYHNTGVISHPDEIYNVEHDFCINNRKNNSVIKAHVSLECNCCFHSQQVCWDNYCCLKVALKARFWFSTNQLCGWLVHMVRKPKCNRRWTNLNCN